MKKWLLGVFLILIVNFSYAENVTQLEKRMISAKFSSEIDFKNVVLSDALSVLSKSSGITMIADISSRDEVLDLYIGRGKSLKEIVDTLRIANSLKTKVVGDVVVFSKRSGAATGDNTIVGKVTAAGYENGIDGVEITLLNSGLNSLVTQYKGMFIMENVNPGIYILRAIADGYEVSGELVEVKGAQNNFIEVELIKDNPDGYVESGATTDPNNGERLLGQIRGEDGGELVSERIILKHAFPDDVKNVLESSLDEVEVSAFSKLNMIIVKGSASNLIPAKKLIHDLDTPQKQVRITAQILDLTDNLFEDLGFDWYYNGSGIYPDGKTSLDRSAGGNFDGVGGVEGIGNVYNSTFNLLRSFNGGEDILDVSINMLQATQDLAISAVPSVVIVNGEEAEFKITDEVIVGEEEVEEDDDITRTSPIFEEAGLVFKVIPIIREGSNEEDTVLLEVDTEVSNFNLKTDTTSDEINNGTFNEDGGSKSVRNIRTIVSVKDGESIFIGGLKRAEVTNLISKIPFLGDLPGIGFVFRNETTKNEMRDVFIKIKAEIVTTQNAGEDINLEGFKRTELHRMEREIEDHRRIYPKLPKSYQLLGSPNITE